MMLPVLFVVLGLFHVTVGDISSFCMSSTKDSLSLQENSYFLLNVAVPSTGRYTLNTFNKATSYHGTFVATRPLSAVIIQARAISSARNYGFFTSNPEMFTLEECVNRQDSLVGRQLQPQRYNFVWNSDIYTLGDIQFWVAVQVEGDRNYTWVEGPKYRASTDYDINDNPPTGESTTHKVYYIVVPSILFVLMAVMVVGSMMVFSKVKYGTVCCCSEWGTPIMYRYARKYQVRRRQNRSNNEESAREQPPSYDSAVQEEDRTARQNVARYELTVAHGQEDDVTDDHVPLTGP